MTTPNWRPKYMKLEKIAPSTHDHNIVVKVLEKRTIVDKLAKNALKVRQEEVLIGDETGCALLIAHDDFCNGLVTGETVALHNVNVKLVQKRMRLSHNKWSSIKRTTIAIPGEVKTDPNFSDRVYELLDAKT